MFAVRQYLEKSVRKITHTFDRQPKQGVTSDEVVEIERDILDFELVYFHLPFSQCLFLSFFLIYNTLDVDVSLNCEGYVMYDGLYVLIGVEVPWSS